MRAVVCPRWGGPEVLAVRDMPRPAAPAGGAVRVAVAAAGVNFADLLMVAGKYQENPPLPFVPGFEVAGVVEEASDGAPFRPGEAVMGMVPFGGFAEEVVLSADQCFAPPPQMDLAAAAGFPVAYGTAAAALVWRARVRPGEVLLVFGAAGGVGLAAVGVGRALGAEVIAVAAGAERLAVAARQGAHHGIDRLGEDVEAGVRALTGGRGADVVVDPVGGEAFETAVRAIAPGGRLVVLGFASGAVGQLSAGVALGKNMDLVGCYFGAYRDGRPDLVRALYGELGRWCAAGRLAPEAPATLPLADAPEALARLSSRATTGKIVLHVRERAAG